MSFVHLHLHSHFSFLDGLGKPTLFAKKAKELGMPGVALTDSGNLHGAFEIWKACKDQGINPILGLEANISKKGYTNRDRDNEVYKIILLAKNIEGYRNLVEMTTRAYLEGFYYVPRIDFDILEKYKDNLIALSGCTQGEIAQHIITGKPREFIVERVKYYQSLFGADDFYLELQEHPDRTHQDKINEYIVGLHRDYGWKIVATNDCHYATENDSEAQDLLFCIGDGRALDDPDRPTLIEGNYSLRPAEEMAELFSYAPQALSATLEINEKVNIQFQTGLTLLPIYTLPDEENLVWENFKAKHGNDAGTKKIDDTEWFLRYLCYQGLRSKYDFTFDDDILFELIQKNDFTYPDVPISKISPSELHEISEKSYTPKKYEFLATLDKKGKEIIDRLEYELVVIDLMGFNSYFTIVADFVGWAKKNEIPVGPWRGSGAGSIVAYLSNITNVEPLQFGLLFERFLNPARVSMPDFDLDFSDEERDKVVDYVRKKYGEDHVVQICTFGTMAARAAVKDVGKVLGVPFSEMNALAKLIPSKPGTKLKDALEESEEFKQAYDSDPRYKKIIDNALRLEGTVRQLGVHACAVIIAPQKMTTFCALQHPPKDPNTVVSQFSAGPIEELGLLKMDFLGLRNLAIIKRCLLIVEKNHGIKVNLDKIDYHDPKVFRIFAAGDTTGVFQFESSGMRKYLKELKPDCIEDIIAMASLYRPGPMGYIPTYINRKHGREKVAYPHPSLEKILKATNGIAVYQEQIMQLVQAFAGFSLGEADILRRAIGKKKFDLLMEQKEKFIKAAEVQGHPEKLAKYIFEDIIEPFASYGFNKSHAACYAVIAYHTAYLKAHYTTEFMTALMVSDEEDMDRITLEIGECDTKNIKILAPDVNESMNHFTYIDESHIRFGLKAIKGLGSGPIEAIRKGRAEHGNYSNIEDFIKQTSGDVINKKSLEALILSGAMDCLGDRAELIASIPKMCAYQKEEEKKGNSHQIGLFDFMEVAAHLKFALEKSAAMSYEEKILGEKASIGYSVSGHPLDGLEPFIISKSQGLNEVLAMQEELNKAQEILQQPEEGAMPTSENEEGDVVVSETVVLRDDLGPNDPILEEKDEEIVQIKEKKKEKKALIKARLIGFISSVRKIQTKGGKAMLAARCESAGFIFGITIFPRDYEKYVSVIVENKIILVDGFLKPDTIAGTVSISPNEIKIFRIDDFRKRAQEAGLFDADLKLDIFSEGALAKALTRRNNTSKTPKKDNKYIIRVISGTTPDDLKDLKNRLLQEEEGPCRIFLYVQNQEIDTKLSLASLQTVKDWEEEMKNKA